MGLDMNAPYYTTEATWRAEMLAAENGTRQAVRELSFLISALFLAFTLGEYMGGLAIVVGAIMCAGCIFTIWRESRAQAQFIEAASATPELTPEPRHSTAV